MSDVIQSDRDAVQAFHREMGRRLMSDIKNGTKLMDAKGEDSDPIYQAFAAHRIASEAALRERVAVLEGALMQVRLGDIDASGTALIFDNLQSVLEQIDAALTTLKGTPDA